MGDAANVALLEAANDGDIAAARAALDAGAHVDCSVARVRPAHRLLRHAAGMTATELFCASPRVRSGGSAPYRR